MKITGKSLLVAALSVVGLMAVGRANASTALYWNDGSIGSWDNSTANWSTASGGSPSSAWVSGDIATYYNSSVTLTIPTGTTIVAGGLYAESANATVNGGTIDLGSSGLSSDNNTALTVNSNLALTANQTWRPGGNNGITVGGPVSGGGYTVTIQNTSNYGGKYVDVNGAINNLGGLILDATNTTTLTVGASGSLGLGAGSITTTGNQATLALDNATAIDSAATLSLGTGNKGILDYTGNLYLTSLILGGTVLGPGTYSASNESGYFSGSGIIVVGAALPEPASLGLVGVGAVGLLLLGRKALARA